MAGPNVSIVFRARLVPLHIIIINMYYIREWHLELIILLSRNTDSVDVALFFLHIALFLNTVEPL